MIQLHSQMHHYVKYEDVTVLMTVAQHLQAPNTLMFTLTELLSYRHRSRCTSLCIIAHTHVR